MRGTKGEIKAILEHLKTYGTITSMEAFTLYGITRLSAQIFELRKEYQIDSVQVQIVNRFGTKCRYAQYIYKGKINIYKGEIKNGKN